MLASLITGIDIHCKTPTINEARQVATILIDKAVDVLELLDAVLRQAAHHFLTQLEQHADLVTLGMDKDVATRAGHVTERSLPVRVVEVFPRSTGHLDK